MKLTQFITIHGVISVAIGIAFALYGPLVIAYFAIPEVLDSQLAYWNMAAFVRMFGAAMFGFGILLWSMRGSIDQVSAQTRRGLIFALLLANLLGVIVAITQQVAVWDSLAGYITSGFFAVFLIGYIYFFVKSQNTAERPS